MTISRALLGVFQPLRLARAPKIALLSHQSRLLWSSKTKIPISQCSWRGASPWCRAFSTTKPGLSEIKNPTSDASNDATDAAASPVGRQSDEPVEDNAATSAEGHEGESDGNPGKDGSDGTSAEKDTVSPFPLGIVGCASLVLAGYFLSHFREKDESVLATLERAFEYMVERFNEFFPSEDGPLLPDVKLLNYPPNLPTLVVDLDKVVAKLEYDRRTGWQVKKRPYADRFFRELINYYEIVLWSDDAYPVATDVANRWGLPVIGCIHRDRCTKFKGSYIKDLSKLGRDLRRVILLDHDRVACMMQEGNAILIREFDGDENDRELLHLIGLLKTIAINPTDVTRQLSQLGGGMDTDLGRRFAEKSQQDSERAKTRQGISKLLGFKHY
ncbi:mitochondrial import inner membrane translocase subunit [Babesia ovata]|uniref:Mitochondrial import inner membrane translocase subunit TIM50 n=1 Tax=Babesia ovata TaxID=189622 RepID=A0A2H6KHU0_9APIC|nr:mitochondrial import inner membrane translocase subunit [Babesia ovata]GBE62562.1 mitochondrial import inner membrane translocase subunit [Babesia ovata]